MKKIVMCIYALLVIIFSFSCSSPQNLAPTEVTPTTPIATQIAIPSPEQLALDQSLTTEIIKLPPAGEAGNWVLTPGMGAMQNAVFSTDGTTIYGLGSNAYSFLRKSTDGGRSWVNLPAFQDLGLREAFNMKMINDEIFIGSMTYGIFHTADGGNTFNQLPPITTDPGVWGIDATLDDSGKIVVLAGIGNGLWTLSYPYENWVDTRVCNQSSGGSGYMVWQVAFSPNYGEDGQIIALVGENQRLKVSFKYGDEAWGKRIADVYIPEDTFCDLKFSFSQFAFPDDYDAQHPTVFIGTGIMTEVLTKTPQYCDVYRIDGMPAGSGASRATDLDVAGPGTSTPINSVSLKGAADAATIIAGGPSQVYWSSDSGRTWQAADKPPTSGTVIWTDFDPLDDDNSTIYAITCPAGTNVIPRGFDVPVGEPSFSRSTDGGATWEQISQIDTKIDEIIDVSASPDYTHDNTVFTISRSYHLLTTSINEGEMLRVTREPDIPGVTATVYIVPHQANSPLSRMFIHNGDPSVTRKDWDTGTGPDLVLDDQYPYATIEVIPQTEDEVRNNANAFAQWLPGYADPWYTEELLKLYRQPRQVLIYIVDGSVTVTKGKVTERMSIDGSPVDWQGIEPILTDPGKDATDKNEDLKAFYVTNDDRYLYLMFEFYGQNPRKAIDAGFDLNFDGTVDCSIHTFSPDHPDGPFTTVKKVIDGGFVSKGMVAFGQVVELAFPLTDLNLEKLRFLEISMMNWTGSEFVHNPEMDEWRGSLDVTIKEVIDTNLTGTLVNFPATDSLWKTTDGGVTWERVLTSGLLLYVNDKTVKVGSLKSVAFSINFAQDHTIYVFEEGDGTKVWASTDGGLSFVLCE